MHHRLQGACLALCLSAAAVTVAASDGEPRWAPPAEAGLHSAPEPQVRPEPPSPHEAGPERAPDPAPAPEPALEPAAEPVPEAATDLASLLAYSAGVQLAAGRDPQLAARYLAFWHLLAQGAGPAELDDAQAARIEALVGRVGRPAESRGPGSAGSLSALLPGVISALAAERGGAPGGSQALLAAADRVLAPRMLVNGRYEFAARLDESADPGLASDVWLHCRVSPRCVALHDRLFGPSMAGVSLGAAAAPRLAADAGLQSLPGLGPLLEQAAQLDQRLAAAGGAREAAAAAAGAELWKAIGAQAEALVSGAGPKPDPAEMQRLLALGRGSAWLAGSGPLGGTFGIVGGPLLEFAQLGAQGALAGSFIGATAGVGLLLAGAQALAGSSPASGRAGAQAPELARLLGRLQETTYSGLLGLRSETLLTGNALDARLVGLGLSLDGLRDDVARIESAQRARLRAEQLQQEVRRWSAFEEDNDRCFSLRSRDAAGRLRPAEFRRCEERFLQGAIRRSQYAGRAGDYVLDPAFLEPADLRFPFHRHYPLLLASAGLDASAALALVDPFEWQQHAAALLRLYQEQPAAPGDFARRREALRELRGAGQRVHDALASAVLGPQPLAAPAFQVTAHERVLGAHFAALDQLIGTVAALDDPLADPYGKRLTAGLDQPLPGGQRRAALEERLKDLARGGRGLEPCGDAHEAGFVAGAEALQADSRRWFGSPITADEVAQGWNRGRVGRFSLQPGSVTEWLPPPVAWAALEGLGEIELCLARLRPASLAFSREESLLRGHRDAQVEVESRIEVRFHPAEALRRQARLPDDSPLLLAAAEARRSCSFAYRADAGGCSRGACAGQLADRFWSAGPEDDVNGGRCEGPPLPVQLAAALRPAEPLPAALPEALETLYWERRADRSARLSADARRSNEYVAASASALHYFALATVTVAAWPDPGSPLTRLFDAEGPLSPRSVVASLVEARRPPEALRAELAAERERLMQWVRERGREVEQPGALYRMPQMLGLREALTRVELALAAYDG